MFSHTHTHTHSPLMSLDTTIHLTVRQKGRLGDQFIGHIPIPLRDFSITSKLITHWYKLGSRPGKIKNKLRGDLQISIRFMSKWSNSLGSSAQQQQGEFGSQSPSLSDGFGSKHPRRMLTRSKSDMRLKVRDVMATGLIDGKPATGQPKVKDRLTTAIRRSFRKKNKTPIFQECEDEFTFSNSASSSPVLRKRSNTLNLILKGAQSDSDTGTPSDMSQSPATVHPDIQVQLAESGGVSAQESESSGDNLEEGAEEKQLQEKEDKKIVSPSSVTQSIRLLKTPQSL